MMRMIVSLMMLALFTGLPMARPYMQIQQIDDQLLIHYQATPFLVYQFKNVPYKPYIKELYTPAGYNILLDAPHDHLHHHGLMYAVSINGVSYWEETEAAGMQLHEGIDMTEILDGKDPQNIKTILACFTEKLTWAPLGNVGDAKKPSLGEVAVCTENRRILTWFHEKQNANILVFKTSLDVPVDGDSITISGAHYYGLGMRFAPSMDNVGVFINAENSPGVVFRGEERLAEADWCAYIVEKSDHPVTVAMLAPLNSKTTWFTMPTPFAYLSATLRYHENTIEIKPGSRHALTYAVAVWDGVQSAEQIQSLYKEIWPIVMEVGGK
jgi:hypothetical protein